MLTLYKAPRSECGSRSRSSSSDESNSSRMTIPAGRPYITKVNGKLVMARDKREKNADVALDLLGEVFGPNPRTRIIRKRSKSINEPKGPLLINGIPYVQQLGAPMPPNTAPIPQQGFTAMPPPVMPLQYPLPYPTLPSPVYPPQYPQPYYQGQVPTFLIQPPPTQPQNRPQSQPQSKPTKEDLDQLVKMDSHFDKKVDKDGKSVDPFGAQNGGEKVIATKTTVTIVKHVCAHCGRLRSRKYHHEHPIKDGEIPAPAFCRKCQRDSSSTSESSSSGREERRKEKKDTRKKRVQGKKHNKKVVVSSSEDESPKKQDTKQSSKLKSGPANKKEGIPFDPKEEYIVIEEELSEEDRKPRGRKREKTVIKEYDGPSRSLSPLDFRSYPRRAHSAAERQEEAPRKSMHPPKPRQTERSRQHSPSSEYTRAEVSTRRYDHEYEEAVSKKVPIYFVDEVKYDKPVTVSSGYHREHEEEIHPRKIPLRYVEGSVVYENSSKSRESYRKEEETGTSPVQYVEEIVYVRPAGSSTVSHRSYHDRQHSGQAGSLRYTTEEVETFSRGLASLESTIDERSNSIRDHPRPEYASRRRDSYDSSRSSERRRRRRRDYVTPKKTWEAPYPAEEEDVVVTEKFESRIPRPQPHDEAERRRREYVDRTTLYARDQSQRFARDDAARYFREDWERVDAMAKQRRPESIASSRQRPRRPSLAESYDYTISRVGCEIPVPKVPTPPPPQPEFTYYSELEDFDVLDNSWCNGTWEKEHPRKTHEQERSTSRRRSAYVRDESDEKALIPSPAISRVHSRERIVELHEDEVSLSSISERERLAELGARHVTFRDTPSMKSAAAWSGSEKDPSPSRKERNGKGAEEDDETGGGWDGAELVEGIGN